MIASSFCLSSSNRKHIWNVAHAPRKPYASSKLFCQGVEVVEKQRMESKLSGYFFIYLHGNHMLSLVLYFPCNLRQLGLGKFLCIQTSAARVCHPSVLEGTEIPRT